MDIATHIQDFAEALLGKEELFVVDVKTGYGKKAMQITITIDGDNGVMVDDCAAISKRVADKIEEEGLITSNYNLVVSSSGLDKPLKLRRQYTKNIGRGVTVTCNDGKQVKGKLLEVNDETVLVEEKKKAGKKTQEAITKVEVPFKDISKTKVEITFK